MGLEDECSRSRCDEEEQKGEIQEKIAHFDEIKIYANGSSVDVITKALETLEKAIESTSRVSVGSAQTEKGFGLKKWRRIRRDINKDGSTDVDENRILKRGLSNAETEKKQNFSDKNNPKSQASAVANSTTQNFGYSKSVVKSAFPVGKNPKKNQDSSDKNNSKSVNSPTQNLGSAFLVGTDPDNSEDGSSKSSAASAPKLWREMPAVIQFTGDKLVTKNLGGKIFGNNAVMQRAQPGKGFNVEKKNRGRVKIEKETYSRSTNASFSGVSNEKQREWSSNYEPQSMMEGEADCYKENGAEVETFSSEDSDADESEESKKEEESENHRPYIDLDPYVDSINLLQTAQEALEKEIQIFRTVGKESVSPSDDSSGGPSSSAKFDALNLRTDEPNLSGQFRFEEMETELIKVNQRVNLHEHELEEASAVLRTKERKILELESILNSTQLPKQEIECNLQFLKDKYKEMETEFEGLFKEKIEAEIEYLMVTRTIRKWKHEAKDQIALLEGQKSLSECKSESVLKPSDAENMATMLRKQPEELEACCKELLGPEELIKMQKNACKLTLYLFIQFVVLCITFGLFLLKISPHATGDVPT